MKRKIWVALWLTCSILFGACASPDKNAEEMYIYYINADGNALLQEAVPNMNVEKAIEKLKSYSVLPKEVEIVGTKQQNSSLSIYFNKDYYHMAKSTEVLLRAAFVQTLTQIDGVEFVAFYIDEEPLKDEDGYAVGLMRSDDFVQTTGSSIDSYQTTDLTLYFADKEGKGLKESQKSNVRYNASTSIEKLVVERLMKGTSASGSQPTIPKTAKLLGVSVKEGICYVNFDSKFSTDSYDLDPQVAVYSVVNSIIANSSVSKVQILIDGASDVLYKNSVDLSRPLEWNVDLIKE